MLVFRGKIKILIIYQLTYILYHFKADSLYFKSSWIIKAKQTLIGPYYLKITLELRNQYHTHPPGSCDIDFFRLSCNFQII